MKLTTIALALAVVVGSVVAMPGALGNGDSRDASAVTCKATARTVIWNFENDKQGKTCSFTAV